jgi:Tfp pilus assembly protein PilX
MLMTRFHRGEQGIALTSVVIVAFIMLLLVGSTVSFAVNSQDLARRDQDWNAALAAAEAGIDDYLYRLNRVDAYWQYSAITPPPDGNNAFTQWVPVPGATNEGKFRYTVDASTFTVDGTVKIASTGLVGKTTRTVYSTLRRRNFLDYLYYTDFETKDPAAYVTAIDGHDPAWAQANCAQYWYAGRNPQCISIHFVGPPVVGFTDTIRGPLHSNDAILISGAPRFEGETSTSWITAPHWRPGTNPNPVFVNSRSPFYQGTLTLPPSNTIIKNYTNPVLGETGCLYTGATKIVLRDGGGVGKMDVTSPYTISTNPGCGPGNNLDLPPNGVIYVQGIPFSDPSDPNYRASCPSGAHPIPEAAVPNDMTVYNKCVGDAFVSGELKGRLTIATSNNIVVHNHITYDGGLTGTDLLGLVADQYVEVWHPIQCTATGGNPPRCTAGTNLANFTNAQIHAAILSVNHSFRVQNYNLGSHRQQLRVRGAIAQRYRGIVGTFGGSSTGYEKDYLYDNRLKYQAPPHFLDPVQSAWRIATWAENKPCYADGTSPVHTGPPYDDYCS